MTSIATIGRSVVVFAAFLLFAASSRGVADVSPTSIVAAPALDPLLERLSDAQLIDRLQELDMSRFNVPRDSRPSAGFAMFDDWIDLSAPDSSIRIRSPELRELVRRGISALPSLLEHVSDGRQSRIIFAVARPRQSGSQRTVSFGDEYDSRVLPVKGSAGVNTSARISSPVEVGYAVKVGDLCYVAIGQIVNRRLFVFSYTNAGFDDRGHYRSGGVLNGRAFGFSCVDSPVETPALAAAVRSDWSGLNAQSHAESLRSDSDSGRNADDAFCRLLSYYPSAGRAAVHAALQRVLDSDGEVNFWSIDRTVASLTRFWWEDLGIDLTALTRMAVRQDRRFNSFEDTRKNPLATGTASVLATCAGLLVHHGDDAHLHAIVVEEIDRLRQQRKQFGGDSPSAYDYHLDRFESVLRRLDGEPEAKATHPEELPARPGPPGVNATLDRIEVAAGRYSMIRLRFGISGISRSDMAAARIRITNARDDTGFDLTPVGTTPTFVHPAVGRTDDSVLSRNDPPSLDALVDAPPGPAKRLVTLKGYAELVVPSYDDASTVRLERVGAAAGVPIQSAALATAHVSVTVFDVKTCNEALSGTPGTPDGVQSYGAQPHYHGPIPAGAPPDMFKEPALTDSDIALGIDDIGGRVVATEFVAPDGTPLRYNHNGWYHATGVGGRRFDVYRLDPKDVANATLVLRLAVGNALVRLPFEFSEVALPDNLF